MKAKIEKPPEYNRWPISATRFLLPTIAIRGFTLDGLRIHLALWKWQRVIVLST